DSTRRLSYRPGSRVEILHHGVPVFAGSLLEPDGDTMHARGLYHQASDAQAVCGGSPSSVPDHVISDAKNRGVLDWRWFDLFSASPFGEVDGPQTVADVLNGWTESVGKVWRVGGDRIIRVHDLPTTPRWHVVPGAAELTVADDSYVSTIFGRYLDSTSFLYATATATDAAAAARFGPREATMDLTANDLALSSAEAQAIVNNRLAMGAARPGWANPLQLASWQLTSPGGAPANLRAVRGGDMVRILGQMDMTIATGPKPYIDIIADEVSYVDGAETITIKPMGLEARTLTDVLTLALA